MNGESGRGSRILLAEDLQENRDLMRMILEQAGRRVDAMGDGQAALEAVKAHAYDLVLMDIQMPVLDGLAAIRAIRSLDAPARHIPIIALSGDVRPRQAQALREAGADDCLGKPARRAELLSKVEEWLTVGPVANGSGQSAVEGGAVLDSETFSEVYKLLGPAQTLAWLERLQADLVAFVAGETSVRSDRERLFQRAHAFVSQAGALGYHELMEACVALEGACSAGADLTRPLAAAREAGQRALRMIPEQKRACATEEPG